MMYTYYVRVYVLDIHIYIYTHTREEGRERGRESSPARPGSDCRASGARARSPVALLWYTAGERAQPLCSRSVYIGVVGEAELLSLSARWLWVVGFRDEREREREVCNTVAR